MFCFRTRWCFQGVGHSLRPGTPEDFLIDEEHRRGIRVFLEVITHGAMPDSSLLKRHPDWFRGGSYGMVDYDWDAERLQINDIYWTALGTACY
jgi:hypothetical protein